MLINIFFNFAFAEVGVVLNTSDSVIKRNEKSFIAAKNFHLQEGDEIISGKNESRLKIKPATIIEVKQYSKIKILSHSTIQLNAGSISVTVNSEMKVKRKIVTDDVEMLTENAIYGISFSDGDTELHVISGEVEMKSPFVQTFVPEIIKKNEARKYLKKKQIFQKIPFRSN